MLSSDFHCKENDGFRVVPVHPGLIPSNYGVHEVGVIVCGVQYESRPRPIPDLKLCRETNPQPHGQHSTSVIPRPMRL